MLSKIALIAISGLAFCANTGATSVVFRSNGIPVTANVVARQRAINWRKRANGIRFLLVVNLPAEEVVDAAFAPHASMAELQARIMQNSSNSNLIAEILVHQCVCQQINEILLKALKWVLSEFI